MATNLPIGWRNFSSAAEFEVQRSTVGEIEFIQNVGASNVRLNVNRAYSNTITGSRGIVLLKPGDLLRVENGDIVRFFDACDVSMLQADDVKRLIGTPVGSEGARTLLGRGGKNSDGGISDNFQSYPPPSRFK